MSIVERVWSTAHACAWFPRWELFQLAAVVTGAVLVARERDAKLVRAYGVGVVLAVVGAIALGSGGEWASFIARGARGPLPELEVAGFGAIGGLVIGYVATARLGYARKKSIGPALDALAPAMGAMTAVARLGCFFAGCDFGAPTALPWALRYPHLTPAFRAQLDAGLVHLTDARTLPVHPTQLYESLLGVVVTGVALAWPRVRRDRAQAGERFAIALLLYAAGRFAIDLVRGDLAHGALGLTVTQWLSLALGGALVAAWSAFRTNAGDPRHRVDPPSSPESRRSSPPTAAS